jgi:hypothetical protein
MVNRQMQWRIAVISFPALLCTERYPMASYGDDPMKWASVLGCFLVLAGGAAADEGDDLSAALIEGSWVKDLGNAKMRDRYVYTFAKDGTYKSVLISDFTSAPTTTGKWQLDKDKDGKVHPRLSNEDKKYPWLGEDSVIRYDVKKVVLVVSGERYAGEVPLRHEKAK